MFQQDSASQRLADSTRSHMAFSLVLLVFGTLDPVLSAHPADLTAAWLLRGASVVLTVVHAFLRRRLVITQSAVLLPWLCQGALLVQVLRSGAPGALGSSYGLSALLLYLTLIAGASSLAWTQCACATAAVVQHALLQMGSPSTVAAVLLGVAAVLTTCASIRAERLRREEFALRCSGRIVKRQCELMQHALLPPIFEQEFQLSRRSDADLPETVLGPVETSFAVVELDNLAALEARLEAAELLAALHVLHVLVQALCDKHQVQMVSFGGWHTCA